ncbi:hypothetical protein CEXT_303051 [Caerostris extrusa]|uniref:Uncharacterized protein n=1 Tax=Caerostris extrusa TaxID=172846 RepID=A0AAV4UD14_CAEEX|nr:hypothetical protein CEXT_303051 [Caerostris extrusa]
MVTTVNTKCRNVLLLHIEIEISQPAENKQKRNCAFNLLGSDCDYTPMAGMSKDHSFRMSLDGPGKKRRKRSCLINMPGLNCDFNQMVGTGKDLGVWSSLAAPGKKRR